MSEHGAAIRYRPDIDGLRAAAVLPILLFHAGIQQFGGGFIGVDVFFVISGFLITGILTREIGEDRFTILGFYRRRFVRILPALAVVLAATLGYGLWFGLPVEIRELGHSVAAAAGFASNIYFYVTTDYFGGAAESKPLLHTWSLGVEEQFYIFYPLLLVALHRYARRALVPLLVLLTALSFALGLYLARADAPAGFYLLPARVWELALGGLVALGVYPKLERRSWRTLASVVGLAAILLGVAKINSGMPFPAPFALLPCGGAALLIAYGSDAVTARLLSWGPVRWIGAISYSLYLWHWPLITFYRLRFGATLGPVDTVILVAASIAFAAASYSLVEQPCLRRWRNGRAGPIVAVSLAGVAVVVGVALAVSAKADALKPVPPAVERLAEYVHYDKSAEGIYQYRPGKFFAKSNDPHYDFDRWLVADPKRPNIVVLGDSHAAQLWRAIAERHPEANVLQATAAGCRPVLDGHGAPRCTRMRDYVFDTLVPNGRIRAVVLAGRWLPKEDSALARTVRFLRDKGVAVTLVGPDVEYDGDYAILLARAMLAGDAGGVRRFRVDLTKRETEMRRLAAQSGAIYHSLSDRECPAGRCFLFAAPGVPVHFDYGHLTLPAARHLTRDMDPFRTPNGPAPKQQRTPR